MVWVSEKATVRASGLSGLILGTAKAASCQPKTIQTNAKQATAKTGRHCHTDLCATLLTMISLLLLSSQNHNC